MIGYPTVYVYGLGKDAHIRGDLFLRNGQGWAFVL